MAAAFSPAERRGRGLRGLAVGLVTALVVLGAWLSGAFERLELRSYDWRVQMVAPFESPDDAIVLILLDQTSLDTVRDQYALGWPWPRELHGRILAFLDRAGARSVGFDVLYLDPSGHGRTDDRRFGERIAAHGDFVTGLFLSRESGSDRFISERGGRERLRLEGGPATLPAYSRAQFPIDEVGANSRWLGNVTARADVDGIYRRLAPVARFDGRAIPALGLAAHLATADVDEPAVLTSVAGGQRLTVADTTIPLDEAGRALLRFQGQPGERTAYSAAAVLQSALRVEAGREPVIDPEELRGRHVLFGFSAPGLHDLRPTPLASNTPGVAVQATFLDNLLNDDFIRPAPAGVDVALVLLLALLAAFSVSFAGGVRSMATAFAVFLPLPVVVASGAYVAGWWLGMAAPLAAVAIALTGAAMASYATEGRQRRFIKAAFGQYLSPAVIENLLRHPEQLKLGGERREITIFFSDLEGFTGLSEGLSPEELTGLLNDYLSAMTDIIQVEGGTIDKYEGDAIIAFWNAPLNLPDHAERGVRAALRCQERLAELRPWFRERVGRELRMRVGINTGSAVVGNMGSHNRFDYTMLGDAVNLAARLEGINKVFGSYTLISGETAAQLGPGFITRELSRVAVVGRAEPVTVHEPLTPEQAGQRQAILQAFDAALRRYYAGDFAGAVEGFAAIADVDAPAQRYLERCRALQAEPPTGWDGIWVMTEK